MRKQLATLTLCLFTAGICWADEAVVRVQSIKPAAGSGPAVLKHQRPADPNPYQVSVNSTGYVKDHYITDANTVAALEFLIGGRVGINKNTDITIVNERSVADANKSVKRIILKNGALWVKADARQLKQGLEIQTNGGVMGIKGTEFTVETQPGGPTSVACFESNSEIGGVEIRDPKGKLVGVVQPGQEFLVKFKEAAFVDVSKDVTINKYESGEALREQKLNSPTFRDMYNGISTVLGAFGSYLPYGTWQGVYAVGLVDGLINEPATTIVNYGLSHAPVSVPFAGSIGGLFSSGSREPEKPKIDFPHELSPDAGPNSKTVKEVTPLPVFSWKGVEDARSYVVMVSPDEKCEEVLFSDQIKASDNPEDTVSLTYPSTARPLAPGKYFWRVVPVDEEDRPVKKGSQTYFTVKK